MQTIKTMLKSPRFLIGFILVMTVVLFAVIYPMVDTRDPKANRLPNEAYEAVAPLRAMLDAGEGENATQEIARLIAQEEADFGPYQALYGWYTQNQIADYKIENRSANIISAAVDKMDWAGIYPTLTEYIDGGGDRSDMLVGMRGLLEGNEPVDMALDTLRGLDTSGLDAAGLAKWQQLLDDVAARLAEPNPPMAKKLLDDYYRARGPMFGDTVMLGQALTEVNDGLIKEIVNLNLLFEQYATPTLLRVQAKIDSTAVDKAASAVKQIKRTNALYAELEPLRAIFDAKGEDTAEVIRLATEEIARVRQHNRDVLTAAEAVREKGAEAVSAIVDETVRAEFESLNAEDIVKGAQALADAHGETGQRLDDALSRLSGVGVDFGGFKPGDPSAIKILTDGIPASTLTLKNLPPSREHPLGTDMDSRDVLLELAHAARLSLMVGLIAGCIATVLGIIIGLLAGYIGGVLDSILTTWTNLFLVIPSFVILILLSVAMGQIREAWITGLVIGLTAWPWTAKSVRAQTVSLRYRDHVNMARITGNPTWRIIAVEIAPYIASYIVMAFILQVASGIISEATLSILGLGNPSSISLGRMINRAQQYESIVNGRWWEFVPVAVSIAMITFGLYMMNSGMDQVFNPKIRS
jgi:peptide/nickel transport system permease protein